MDTRYRRLFNRAFSPALYQAYAADLARRLDCRFEFRLAETPVFVPPDLRDRCERVAREIVRQLSEPGRLQRMKAAVPARFDAPGIDRLPSFAQVDFAIVRADDGSLEPKLIELQGFPSLTAFQVVQRDAWSEQLRRLEGLDETWSCWFSGLSREQFLRLARRTILGGCDPETVILLDLDPRSQKTFPDFSATKRLFGVDAVDPRELERAGRQLFRRNPLNGSRIPVRRIHNRVVFDELERKRVALPFDFRDDLDLAWAPHPNWYWIWSKYSIPLLDHPAVPRAVYLSELDDIPKNLPRRYVLKPLFSFAGGGVLIEPTAADIERVPGWERPFWCLQEKIEYAPALEAADGGGVKVEMRMMFLRPDEEPAMILAENLCRLSRGKMLGVDFNKDFTWVGSSVGLWASG
jgi:hypothetical protein